MKKYMKIIMLFSVTSLFGFEVNTHQALTRCAITNECNQNGVKNLEDFIKHAEISTDEIYGEELFDKYKLNGSPVTYNRYIEEAEKAIYDYNVTVRGDYKGMIEAGVILEDAIYPDTGSLAQTVGVGRFNNHFYATQIENTKADCRKITIPAAILFSRLPKVGAGLSLVTLGNTELMHTGKTLCMGIGERTDSIDWVFNKDINLEFRHKNDYGLDDAFTYFKKSFEGNEGNRTKYQAKFFVTLGYMIHLLQDIHSPAHVRDGSHPLGDYLEIYGREKGGFNLRDGVLNPDNNPFIVTAIRQFDTPKYMLKDNSFVSYEDFYRKEADWVGNNFFSEAHVNGFASIRLDSDTIFDSYNNLPSTDTTYENEKDEIVTTGNTIDRVNGDLISFDGLNEKAIALIERSFFGSSFDSEHIIMPPAYHIDYINNTLVKGQKNTRALQTTAINVMPRAVASSQAFLNFFFRAQISASPIYGRRIYILNDSNVSNISTRELATLKSGGKFYIYYMNEDNISKPIRIDADGKNVPYILANDLAVNQQTSFDLGDVFQVEKKIDGETRWMVIFDGNIGEDLGGSNQYGYGMRGVTADIAKDRFERNDENNTVIDYVNNTEWQDESETLADSWYAANRYCNNLVVAGHDDWGLPVQRDLLSILKPRTNPFIYKKYFKHLGAVGYWSSSFHDNYPNPNTAAGISYDTGQAFDIDINAHMNVRCVRRIN